jgi:hypothetical protein
MDAELKLIKKLIDVVDKAREDVGERGLARVVAYLHQRVDDLVEAVEEAQKLAQANALMETADRRKREMEEFVARFQTSMSNHEFATCDCDDCREARMRGAQ